MKNLKRIDEAVGSILERRASADRLLKDVVKGNTSEVEGIKLSKEMADAFLMWLKGSTYGKKFGALPFYKLFTAAPNWGLERYIGKDKKIKDEFKELKAKAKEMSKAEMKGESLDEAIDLLKSSWRGTKGWNDVARIMDAGLMKAIKAGSVSIGYAKDYVKSLERMAKRNAKKFFDEYGNFSEDDFIEDVEYNMANESKVNEAVKPIKLSGNLKKDLKAVTDMATDMVDYAKDNFNTYIPTGEKLSQLKLGGTREKDVLEYNIRHLAKAINTDLKKKYMKDFVAESVNEAKFSFSEDQVKDVAELIAKAIGKMDKAKTAVHDMEYDAGRGAGFEISMDGEKYDGGSYTVRPNGEVYNAAIGYSFPNAIYAKIGDKDINKIIKNIKKFESVTEAEDFKPHMMYDPETGEEYKAEKPEDHERMAKLGYVHEKPEKVDEAKFVKSYDTKVNDAETKKDVSKIYPKAKFFIGKMSHFFGELEPNLFFKAYYPKYYKQDTGKSVKGDFKITSVYSKKGSNYVELMESFESYGKFISENYDTEKRKEMAAKGFALADGSFPIANLEDLKNAIMAYGRAKDQARAAKFIAKRAKALGAEDLIPDSDDFQRSLKEGIEDVYTQVPAKTIAIEEGKDIGSWNQGGLKGDKNVLVTTFVGPKDIEDFGLGRKCMQINVGMDYISLNPADIVELKDILKSYKVK